MYTWKRLTARSSAFTALLFVLHPARAEIVLGPDQWNAVDNTATIQGALQSSDPVIRITNGTNGNDTWITGPLKVPSNKTIYLEAGVRILALKGAYSADDAIFTIRREPDTGPRKNAIAIRGTSYLSKARIEFDPTDVYTSDERRHAISIEDADNVQVDNVHIKYTFGDGIYIGDSNKATEPAATRASTNVTVTNSVVESASRNGITINAGRHILVQNVAISKTRPIKSGIALSGPWAGVDIEPDQSEHPLTDIQINDCDFDDNGSHAILMELSNAAADQDANQISMSVNRAQTSSSGASGIVVKNIFPYLHGAIQFTNGFVHDTNAAAIVVKDKARDGTAVSFTNIEIDHANQSPGNQPMDLAPIVVYKENPASTSALNFTAGNVTFTSLTLTHNENRPDAVRVAGRSGFPVDGVSGTVNLLNGYNDLVTTAAAIGVAVTVN